MPVFITFKLVFITFKHFSSLSKSFHNTFLVTYLIGVDVVIEAVGCTDPFAISFSSLSFSHFAFFLAFFSFFHQMHSASSLQWFQVMVTNKISYLSFLFHILILTFLTCILSRFCAKIVVKLTHFQCHVHPCLGPVERHGH